MARQHDHGVDELHVRRLIGTLIIIGLLLWPSAASAVDVELSVGETSDNSVEVDARAGGGDGPEPTGSSSSGSGEVEYVEVWDIVVDADGNPCAAPVLIPIDEYDPNLPYRPGAPACPTTEPEPAPGPTPEQWVQEFLDRSAPEPPEPSFIPPFGITGERMYLITEADTSWQRQLTDTPFGALTLTGTADITVDWGDDTTTGPHTQPGIAWPDGQINHVWQYTGTYDIVVTYNWDIDWAYASTTGTLTLDQTTTLTEYPVIEVQPVIRYP